MVGFPPMNVTRLVSIVAALAAVVILGITDTLTNTQTSTSLALLVGAAVPVSPFGDSRP